MKLLISSFLLVTSLCAQSFWAPTTPLLLPATWAFCSGPSQFSNNPILCPAYAASAPQTEALVVPLRNSQATGFLYFIDGYNLSGTPVSASGMAARSDVAGATTIWFNGGMARASVIHIVEFSRSSGVFLVLDSY